MRNLRLNAWESRCDPRCEAVSNYCGSSEFTVPSSTLLPTASRLTPKGTDGISGATIVVTVTTADDACMGRGPVDLVKVDVEGFEDEVLLGIRGILEAYRPFLIVEVVHAPYSKLVQEYIIGLGYKFWGIDRAVLVPIRTLAPDPRYTNVLCASRDTSKLFSCLENNYGISTLS